MLRYYRSRTHGAQMISILVQAKNLIKFTKQIT